MHEPEAAANEALFRETNEGIRAVVDKPDVFLPLVPFVCECSDLSCRRLLNVPLAVYERVRSSPRQFLHALEHIDDGTRGRVVETSDGFAVVEKKGLSAEAAEGAAQGGD